MDNPEQKKSSLLVTVLWILLAASVIGLGISIFLFCKSDSYIPLQHSQINPTIQRSKKLEMIGDPNKRCGPECQCMSRFFDPSVYALSSDSPALPKVPNVCNEASQAWLENATPTDVANLTVTKDGKSYRCNRSCPQAEVACGLDSSGIFKGVM